jgi:hypothetical protein
MAGACNRTPRWCWRRRANCTLMPSLFANVGDDSENPATLRYVRDVAMPYAEAHGIQLIELRKTRRVAGTVEPETLLGRMTRPGGRSIPIPVRMRNGAPGNRACTADFKVRLIARWCYLHGARASNPALILLGISMDEAIRARSDTAASYTRPGYPFLNLIGHDQHEFLPRPMYRQDCLNVIADAGLPLPPKSSCWFCPFHRVGTWRAMRDQEPDLFQKAVELEQFINERRATLGKDVVWLTKYNKPLAKVVGEGVQPSLFEGDDFCDSGYCMI